jgi:hypothetical protein
MMQKLTNPQDFVDKETIKAYEEIDGFKVIEELLLNKGVEIAGSTKTVCMKHLERMALITYNFKLNATNKLYVGMKLDKFYLRNCLTTTSGKIKVPNDIYDRVKKLNDSYKNNHNQQEE